MARLLQTLVLSSRRYAHRVEPMHDAPLLLNLLHALLMIASMMLTWQVHRLLGRS